jgi:ATP-dependent exoDNAse (exonuclease V) beta subunit
LYRKVNAVQGFPPQPAEMKQRMIQLLDELREDEELCAQLAALRHLPHPMYSETQWHVLQALLAVLPLAVAELQLVFQARGQADYVEAALRALRALGNDEQPTDLALAFDYRLQHVLIDEFQDTSYSQLELLERLTAGWQPGDGRTLFCVGDPMQSIYRFRQAEVGLFLQLQQSGLRHVKLEPLTLTSNFRSIPAVVNWVNEVFPRVLANRSDAELGAVAYSPSTAALADADGGVVVHPSIDADETDEPRAVAGVIQSLLTRDTTSRVAILVSARNHVAAIADELARNKIDFQAVEIEMLLDRPVVQDLIALTRALVHVGDRTAWLAVLRAPWCGLTLTDLHALLAAPAKAATVVDALRSNFTSLLSADGAVRLSRVQRILEQSLAERGRLSLREWVERTWIALGGPATLQREQDLDDAEAYLQRLEQIEAAGDLEDVAALESQLSRLFARPRTQRGRVEIMTIHKAKGLEFEYVILPGLHRATKGEDRELLRWTRIAGSRGGIVFAPIKAEGADPDPVYRWLALMERERTTRERARLLYVAATRAKRELHLFGNANAKIAEEGVVLGEPRQGSLLKMLWHAVRPTFEGAIHEAHARANAARGPEPLTSLRRLPANWAPPQSVESSELSHARLLSSPKRRPEFDWVSETGRHIGTIVHRELERITRGGSHQHGVSQRTGMRERLLTELAELGVPEERRDAALDRVIAAVESALADDRGRWLLGLRGDLSDAESELALTGFIRGQLVDGVIDRTFRDASGIRWIVDFKTSTHEGAGLDHFLAEEANRYREQLMRYAALMRGFRPGEPVRAALYFPLLREWREVDVE